MNTTEINYNNDIKSFSELYDYAKKQFVHYEEIEGRNWDEYDFSIDCADDQMMFKDMLQIRCVEELTEASISLPEPEEHFWEEIGDSMNFFLSAMVMLGIDLNEMEDPTFMLTRKSNKHKPKHLSDFSTRAYPVIESIGYLCNLLKNRPWAQSNYLVSMFDFKVRLDTLWKTFWSFLGNMGISDKDVFEMFYRKYKVNEYRIETGY